MPTKTKLSDRRRNVVGETSMGRREKLKPASATASSEKVILKTEKNLEQRFERILKSYTLSGNKISKDA